MAKNNALATNAPDEPQAAASYEDVVGDLSVEYVKAKEVSESFGSFNIIGSTFRKAQGRFPDQINFELQFREGSYAGTTAFMTLRASPMRERLAKIVGQRGSIGPLVLVKGKKSSEPGSSEPWVFVSPEAAKAGNVPTDPAATGKE